MSLKTVPLENRWEALGGKMVEFAGFNMPIQFEGIKDEHIAVRNNVGLFDVSHMGEIVFRGKDACTAVDRLISNRFEGVDVGQAVYAVMCNADGGIVDDLIVYKRAEDHVLMCVNASNRDKDIAHVLANVTGDVDVKDEGDDFLQLAIQGPNAEKVLSTVVDVDLSKIGYYTGADGNVDGVPCFISRTGYTGEDGFEIYGPVTHAEQIADAILAAGQSANMALCGLGCRDTLRLESKFMLYGNDMDETCDPFEAGLSWTVKLDREFVGRDALVALKEKGVTRRQRGFILEGRGVLRPGYEIEIDGDVVGKLTSGSFGPTLEKSVGMGYIDVAHANAPTANVLMRGKPVAVSLTKKPFYQRAK